jgi:hypothetical protein
MPLGMAVGTERHARQYGSPITVQIITPPPPPLQLGRAGDPVLGQFSMACTSKDSLNFGRFLLLSELSKPPDLRGWIE